MKLSNFTGRIAIALLALSIALPNVAEAQRRAGNGNNGNGHTTPNGPPGTPAGTNENPDTGCLDFYVWSNVTPSGTLGPPGYARRVNDGQGAFCKPRLDFLVF